MAIVTMISDFGTIDYYPALIKGAILQQFPNITILDITHNIENYDIVQAAFFLRNTWRSFPKNTIHLVSVNDFYKARSRFLAIKHQEHYFIGPDNGIFSMAFDELPTDIYKLNKPSNSSFPLKEIYSKAIAHIANDLPFEKIGAPLKKMTQRLTFQPVTKKAQINGTVIYIDSFENVITNISKSLFDKISQKRSFLLTFKRHNPMTKLFKNYHDVPIGEPLCLFNSAGLLEIAINMGKASSLLGLKPEDTVQINFLEETVDSTPPKK